MADTQQGSDASRGTRCKPRGRRPKTIVGKFAGCANCALASARGEATGRGGARRGSWRRCCATAGEDRLSQRHCAGRAGPLRRLRDASSIATSPTRRQCYAAAYEIEIERLCEAMLAAGRRGEAGGRGLRAALARAGGFAWRAPRRSPRAADRGTRRVSRCCGNVKKCLSASPARIDSARRENRVSPLSTSYDSAAHDTCDRHGAGQCAEQREAGSVLAKRNRGPGRHLLRLLIARAEHARTPECRVTDTRVASDGATGQGSGVAPEPSFGGEDAEESESGEWTWASRRQPS